MASTARSVLGGLVALLLLSGGAAAEDGGGSESTELPPAHAAFAFWSAPPYTPDALSPTVWWLAYLARDHAKVDGVRQTSTSVQTALRVELGLTDSLVAGVAAAVALQATSSDQGDRVRTGVLDAVVELRYRLLVEEDHLVTLTLGPQLVLPTGDPDKDFGLGTPGYGVTGSVGRILGPVYALAWGRFAWFSDIRTRRERGDRGDDLSVTRYGVTLGWKALDREIQGSSFRQTLHLLLEASGGVNTTPSPAQATPSPGREDGISAHVVAPGVQWGLGLEDGLKLDVGLSVPIGVDRDAPDWGVVFQLAASF